MTVDVVNTSSTANIKRVAVVTGASSGIGAATARALAADYWHVIVAARRMDKLEAIANEIGGEAIELDVTDGESVAAFAGKIKDCHLLVNNAGGAKGLDPIASANLEDWQWMYDTNVLGTIRVTNALLETLIRCQGHIINMSSVAGFATYPGGGGYNAAKFGETAASKVMRAEFAEKGLRVTEINPGRVKTDFSLVRFKGDQEKADAVYADKLNLEPEDIAESIRWTASLPDHMNVDRIVITPRDQVI